MVSLQNAAQGVFRPDIAKPTSRNFKFNPTRN